MPFETTAAMPRRVAVIGAGISGMGAAHALANDHRVVLYEAEPRLGGHARTKPAGPGGEDQVDTGFIVFNYENYPRLTALFDHLRVDVVKSDMSFGASFGGGAMEYALASPDAIFATRSNLVNPKFLRMIRDILKFNANALEASREDGLTIGGLMKKLKLSDYFRDHYLLPFSGAIWSTPKEQIMEFPAASMMQFFDNHALLSASGQHQWYTVDGGSRAYVDKLGSDMVRRGVDIRLASPVETIRRGPEGVAVKAGGHWDHFDEVILATHSDISLRMLETPTAQERRMLEAVRYQPNRVVLHSDTSLMPKRRKVWSSWVYTEGEGADGRTLDLNYWMNSLQPWLTGRDYIVTLNSERPIREELIWDETVLHHPVYDLAALEAQRTASAINGSNRTWYCGAWMKNGFHEDGLASALDVVHALNAVERLEVAAE